MWKINMVGSMWCRRILVLVAMLAAAIPVMVQAAGTTPNLVLATAEGAVADGARSVVLSGDLDYPNAVQVGYPVDLVVFQGTRFVRYRVGGPVVTGTSSKLAAGQLLDSELPDFLLDGTPAPAGVRIITLRFDAARVALPSTFTAGPTTAVVFTLLPDGSMVSNPIRFTLP